MQRAPFGALFWLLVATPEGRALRYWECSSALGYMHARANSLFKLM